MNNSKNKNAKDIEAGNVNWKRLEKKQEEQKEKRKQKKAYRRKGGSKAKTEAVAQEKQQLTGGEKKLPYPDDFLAEVNLFNKSIGNFRPANPQKPETQTGSETEEAQ